MRVSLLACAWFSPFEVQMQKNRLSNFSELIRDHEEQILESWVNFQLADKHYRSEIISENTLRAQSRELLSLIKRALQSNTFDDIKDKEWSEVIAMLSEVSATRATQGFSPSETASFVFSLKQPIAEQMKAAYGSDERTLAEDNWVISQLIDKLGLFTTEVYLKSREDIIRRQQKDIMEMSTPVIKLWDSILAVPLIGTLDSARTQIVMESLLQEIVRTGSKIAILDITGVPTVDTQTAQHLIKTVSAARLMGADCIISGIRPQIAQTIVHLGVDIFDVPTKATMADAVKDALTRLNWRIVKNQTAED